MKDRIKLYEKAIQELHDTSMVAVQAMYDKEMENIRKDQRIICFIAGILISVILFS